MSELLPQTETINPRTSGLDEMPVAELTRILASEQRAARIAPSTKGAPPLALMPTTASPFLT